MPSSAPAKTGLGLRLLASKNLRLAVIVLLIMVVSAAVIIDQKASHKKIASVCGPYRSDKVITVSSQKLTAEVASSPSQRTIGLSGRPCITPDQAMLFVFNKPDRYKMWMKDMKFPIDIIWLSPDRRVISVERNVLPSTYPDSFVNKDRPALYVLELKANRSTELGITLGTPVNF